jgi:RNA polymerase sigma factor (sigma-70 family)
MKDHNWSNTIKLALQGDQKAYNSIYSCLDPILTKTIKKKVFNIDSATLEDVKQDIQLKIFTKLNSFTQGRNFFTWAISIAIYHCIDLSRRHASILTFDNNLEQYHNHYHESSLEEYYINQEGCLDIHNFVKENLSLKHSKSIYEKFYLGLKQKEIAKRRNSPLGTISGLQFQSVRALRNKAKELKLSRLSFR